MLGLIRELGLQDKVLFPHPKTVVYYKGKFYPLDSPKAALTFPGFTLVDMARFGFVTVYLRYIADWKPLEKFTAHEWMRKYYGEKLYQTMFEPLLEGKFGPYYKQVNMAWMWARFKARSTRLGTFEGGFQAFSDAFADILRQRGVDIRLSTPVERIESLPDGKLRLNLPGGESEDFDRCLVTVAPGLLARLAPDLPADYLQGLLNLKSHGRGGDGAGAQTPAFEQGYYWYNLPKNAGLSVPGAGGAYQLCLARAFWRRPYRLCRRLPGAGSRVFQPDQGGAAGAVFAGAAEIQLQLQPGVGAQDLVVPHRLCAAGAAGQSFAEYSGHPDADRRVCTSPA